MLDTSRYFVLISFCHCCKGDLLPCGWRGLNASVSVMRPAHPGLFVILFFAVWTLFLSVLLKHALAKPRRVAQAAVAATGWQHTGIEQRPLRCLDVNTSSALASKWHPCFVTARKESSPAIHVSEARQVHHLLLLQRNALTLLKCP